MKICVAVATFGRRNEAQELLSDLLRQSRLPDQILFVVARPEDAPGTGDNLSEVIYTKKNGTCVQRNAAFAVIAQNMDVVLFLDDDFVPHTSFIEEMERAFIEDRDVVGITGLVAADGINGAGYSHLDALRKVESGAVASVQLSELEPRWSLYGCNMAFRTSALDGLRFDENLPLYGWLEDMDFSCQIAKRGRLVQSNRMVGVHRGVKRGRVPGVRFGYSQIANPVYLLRKGTVPKRWMYENMAANMAANALKSVSPEPYVDRRGRLRGNLLAIWDLLRGRSDPMRILEL